MTNNYSPYDTLSETVTDISPVLDQAASILAVYRTRSDIQDHSQLHLCLALIRPLQNILRTVGCFSGALLIREMVSVGEALGENIIYPNLHTDALSNIASGIVCLPDYLVQINHCQHSLPKILLPILNALRAVRGGRLLTATALFAPAIPELSIDVTVDDAWLEQARQARLFFQLSLCDLLNDQPTEQSCKDLLAACTIFDQLGKGQVALWQVASALATGFIDNSVVICAAIKMLLRQIDQHMRAVIADSERALHSASDVVTLSSPPELLKNLLYYVANNTTDTPSTQQIKTAYQLDTAWLTTPADWPTLTAVLEHDLQSIGYALAADGTTHSTTREALCPIIDSLALCDNSDALQRLEQVYVAWDEWVATDRPMLIDKLRLTDGLVSDDQPLAATIAADTAILDAMRKRAEQTQHVFIAAPFIDEAAEIATGMNACLPTEPSTMIPWLQRLQGASCVAGVPMLSDLAQSLALMVDTYSSAVIEHARVGLIDNCRQFLNNIVQTYRQQPPAIIIPLDSATILSLLTKARGLTTERYLLLTSDNHQTATAVTAQRVLEVIIGDDHYALPLNAIDAVIQCDEHTWINDYQYNKPVLHAGCHYWPCYMGTLLHHAYQPKPAGQHAVPLVLLRDKHHAVALQVDQLGYVDNWQRVTAEFFDPLVLL